MTTLPTETNHPPVGPLTRRFTDSLRPGAALAPYAGASRLPVPPAEDRATWDAVDPATRVCLVGKAGDELARPAPVLRASDWARTFRDGVRTAYENEVGALRDRIALFAVAAVLT
ncbi:MAG TPA: heparinase, partial [Streptomyces sp.]